MENIIIRKAKRFDIPDILVIENFCFTEEAFSKCQFDYLITKSNGAFYVIEHNNKLIAYISLLFNTRTRNLRLYSLAIHPEYRKLNLGSRLLDESVKFALEINAKKISLEVNIYNNVALKLYRKFNFTIKKIKPSYYHDGSDAYYMVKDDFKLTNI